jgi:predicted O-linked N-acetylglucosamine transferase (SPINDLY family)
MTGRSFGARMAGALLTAAGLPELITYNLADYEAVALRLANDPARCAQLRTTLGEVREHGVLFDTPAFVRDLETRLVQLVNALPAFHGMTLTS